MVKFLDAGFAVVAARSTVSWETGSGEWENLGCSPAPTLPGHGMFHPPGAVADDVGLAPYDERAYHMPEKDAVMIVQHVRYLARESTSAADLHFPEEQREAMAQLDHTRIAVHGASAGAVSMMWAAFGPDRRDEAPFLGESGQYAEWTRPDAALLGAGPTWLPIMTPGGGFVPFHWGLEGTGATGHSETPAFNFDTAHPDDLVGNSALFYEECAFNDDMPTYMYSWYLSESTEYEKSAPPCVGPAWPICFPGNELEDDIHSVWSSFAWKQIYQDNTEVATFDPDVAAQSSGLEVTLVGDPVLGGNLCDLLDDMVAWAQTEVQPNPWIEIKHARLAPGDVFCTPVTVPGTFGVPQLTGTGTLIPGEAFSIEVTGALPNARAWIVLDYDPGFTPFESGILVPAGTFGATLLPTDGMGEAHISGNWPVLPGGMLWAQYVVLDPGASGLLAFSGGLLGVTK